MPDIDIHRVHGLGMREARAAAERMAEELGRKFDLKGDWRGDVLHFERPGVTGTLAITDKDLRLTATLGMFLKAMRGSIESAVAAELDKLFAPQPPGASKSRTAPPSPKKGG
jgi:putative polyhydroxyalkanoate system protein